MMNKMKGIDISYANGEIDFEQVKASGIEFVIVRTGYRKKKDDLFKSHIEGALKAGLKVGVYCYCLSKTIKDALSDAEFVLKQIKPYALAFPVCYDLEDAALEGLSKEQLTEVTAAFLDCIKSAGYFTAVYANASWLANRLNIEKLKPHDIWLAHWTGSPDIPSKYNFGQTLWQWGAGTVAGIKGETDGDICFCDYEEKARGSLSSTADASDGESLEAAVFLNIRSKPSLSAVKLGLLAPGEIVKRANEKIVSADGFRWVKIKRGKTLGYCAEQFLIKK